MKLEDAQGEGPTLSLDLGLALAISERALGGEDDVASVAPNERAADTELGVLGYVVARWLSLWRAPWHIADAGQGPPPGTHTICWPGQLEVGQARGGVRVLATDAVCENWSLPAHWTLGEGALEQPPAPGDVLIPEHMDVRGQAGDYHALGALRLGLDCDLEAPGKLSGQRLDLQAPRQRTQPTPAAEVALELTGVTVASLAGRQPLPLPAAPRRARVRYNRQHWPAELISYDGYPAARVLTE